MLIKYYTKEIIRKGSANILEECCIISLLKSLEEMGVDGRCFLSYIPPIVAVLFFELWGLCFQIAIINLLLAGHNQIGNYTMATSI